VKLGTLNLVLSGNVPSTTNFIVIRRRGASLLSSTTEEKVDKEVACREEWGSQSLKCTIIPNKEI
jgi:hypothetical protein